MKKYNSFLLNKKHIIAFRIVVLLTFSILISQISYSQVECQDETQFATIGLDRKGWTTNLNDLSQGYLHNFTLPANNLDCKKISNVDIEITVFSVDESGLLSTNCAPPSSYYINISNGCLSTDAGSCPTPNFLYEAPHSFPGTLNFSFSCPPEDLDFGDNIGFDIVPVMNTGCDVGQSAVSSGGIVLDYEICVTTTLIDATIETPPALGPGQTICPNAGTTITLDPGSYMSYQWGPNGETTPTIDVGEGTYQVTVTDINGCQGIDAIIISEHPDSPITFDPVNPNGCDGGSVQVSVVESYGTYNWSNGLTGQVVNLIPNPIAPYTVTITDGNLCEFESSIMVGDVASPDAGSSNFITVCNDGSLTNMDLALGTHDAGGTWNDDDVSGVDVNLNPLAVDFSTLTPSTYTFTYTVPGTAPCLPDNATITVQVFGASEGGNNNFIAVCDGEQVDLTTLLSSDATEGGTFADDNFTSQLTVNNFSTTGLAGGSYDFTYSVGAAPCQPDQAIMTVQVLAAVEAGDNNITTVCEGAQVDLTTLLSFDATEEGSFSDDDFTAQLFGNDFSTTGLAGGSYDFTYNVGTGGGCGSDIAFFTVTVEPSLSSGTSTPQEVCAGEMINLFDVLMGENTGGLFSDITGNGGLNINMLNTTSLPVGINEYQYLVGDGDSCPKDSSLISINIVAAPNISIAADSIDVCSDDCRTITYIMSGTAPFSFNASIFSSNGTFVGGGANSIIDNTFRITACNLNNTESYSNDTLNLLIDSTYIITIPSIEDGNCINNFGGIEDTLYIRAIDYARFELDTFACANDTLTINGIEFFEGNDFLLDTIPGNRCDSIVSIMVDFLPHSDSLLMVPLCVGTSTTINGTLYNDANQSGVDTLFNMSASGCDSIVTVQILPSSGITIERNDTLCLDESIVIEGQTFDFDNQIDIIILSGTGCDTTINVALNFHVIDEGSLIGPFCSDFTTTINGNIYDFNNRIGRDTLENASIDGCDSIVNTNLSFYPPSDSLLIVPLCAGTDININGTLYNDANLTGVDTLFNQSSNGCDSIVMVQITPSANIIIERNDTLCMDGFIVVDGITFDINNPTDQVILTGSGCDTIVDVDLNFYPVANTTLAVSICVGTDTIINGTIYNDTNTSGTDTLFNQSSNGCDSIVMVQIIPSANIIIERNDTLCMDGFIVVDGITFDINNPTDQVNLTGSGCDTIVNVDLNFYPVANATLAVPLCTGTDTIINGTLYNDTNLTGTDTLFNQSANGCDSLVTISISFNPCQFDVVITPTDDLCGDGTIGSIQVETDSPAGETYSIRLTDENGNEELIPNLLGPNIGGIFNSLMPGMYIIEILDSFGTIVATNSISISTTNTPITGSWSITSPVSCEGGTGSIQYTVAGTQDPYMYMWDDVSIGDSPSANGLLAGIYFLTVTDNQGCTETTSFILPDGINQVPVIEIMDPSCGSATDGSIQITGLDSQFGPYTIIVNDNLVDSTFIDGLTDDIYDIVIIDDNLCIIELTETLVAMNPLDVAVYALEYTITEGDSVILVGEVDPGDFTYEWSPENTLSCTDCPFPIASPIDTTLFSLLIFDEAGCSQSIFVTVFVEEMEEEEEEEEEEEIVIQIANIFSPNYDNINDAVIFNFGEDKILAVEIYDRWGNRVLQSESIDGIIIWDGIYNGSILGSGIYVYNLQISDIEGNVERKFGDIMLMR